jgi:hypothetical protein
MTRDPGFDDLLGSDVAADERQRLAPVSNRLDAERPIPQPAFRGELRRMLLRRAEPDRSPPRHLRALITAYGASGLCLLAIAALGVGGTGPFAA